MIKIKVNNNILKLISNIMLLVVIIGCGNQEKKEQNETIERVPIVIEPTFYYPKTYDNHWRMNQPNLEESEGWIKANCDQTLKIKDSLRVKIKWQFLKHKSWGKYEGKLIGIDLKTNEEIRFDFKCFEPDFSKGKWLNNQ
ncbi:hypothetical protein FVF61_11875 [Formosa maritima]|uniref:Uncharacterized protein n=1 Tax=Formosa maritima TaxID=2592046 RepID=A0A5D0G0Y4_9FLAO|nr:hypothetical protein FVF61_11875 [Formosa maritima]